MSSHTGIDKEKKRTQNEKFDETTKLLHDVKVNDNASLNENMNHIFVGTSFNHPKQNYYEEVKAEMDGYISSVNIIKEDLKEMEIFNHGKNEEISKMMPPEYTKFQLHMKNFLAT